ncbi:MAG: phospholipid carrier-dependent glycosyltransferase [Propionibacteriaceae bacterium]|jgi:dolichyl-phosphate-mannose--protein O-mannosyl transferase|nr:phospholipid carrier-dependent glycosyltransferase [Propionibacteriaceae bacterium]
MSKEDVDALSGSGESPLPWLPAAQDPPHSRVEALDTDVSIVDPDLADVATSHRPARARRSPLAWFSRLAFASNPPTSASRFERLSQTAPTDRVIGWVVTIVITAVAFFLRWYRLGEPNTLMFDETYYAKDAWSVLQYGYEGSWTGETADVNAQVANGDWSALSTNAEWAVHPPVGKFLIAMGEKLFGLNAFGWRFAALVFGALLVFLTIRLGRRLSRSTLIGALAGLFVAVDGMSFVMSRIALLDIFQAVFIVAAVACVVADRDYFRNRLAAIIADQPGQTLDGKAGPFVFRPWLVLAGVMFGLGCATKWNTLFALAVFGVFVVIWSVMARHLAGAGPRAWWGLLKDGGPAFVGLVVVSAVIYLLSWIPWLASSGGYDRQWGSQHPEDWVTSHFGVDLSSLWRWHVDTYGFHTGEQMATATHSYASNPWGWPIALRTTGIYALNDIKPGDQGCAAASDSTCLEVVTAIGTPLLWWLAALALVIGIVWALAGLDWRFGVVVMATFATWIPWLFAGRGAMFTFYSITMIPFMAIGLAMVLGVILGPARSGPRRQSGAVIVATIVALIVLNFAFMYPVYTAELLTRQQWSWRMWLQGWI